MSDINFSLGFKTDTSGLKSLDQEFNRLDTKIKKVTEMMNKPNISSERYEKLKNVLNALNQKADLVIKTHGELDAMLKNASKDGLTLESVFVRLGNAAIREQRPLASFINQLRQASLAMQSMNQPNLTGFLGRLENSLDQVTRAIELQAAAMRVENELTEKNIRLKEMQIRATQASAEARRNAANNAMPIEEDGEGGVFAGRLMGTAKQALLTAPIYGAAYAATGSIQQSIAEYIELDTVLNRIAIVTGQTTDQVRAMKEEFMEAARALNTSTQEYAKGTQTFLAQGGAAADYAKELTTTAIQLSNATGKTAEDTSDYLTAIGNSFKLIEEGPDSIQKMGDVLLYLDNASATSADEIGQAMRRAASSFQSAGISYEQASAMIATASEITRQAPERVGTAFKTMIETIQEVKEAGPKSVRDFTSKIQETIDQFPSLEGKLQLFNESGTEMVDTTEFLNQLQNAFSEIKETDPLAAKAVMQAIGGKENANILAALLENKERFSQLLGGIQTESMGAAERAQAEFANSLQAKINQLKAAWEEFINSIISSKALEGIIKGLTGAVDIFNAALGETNQLMKLISIIVILKFAPGLIAGLLKSENALTKFTKSWIDLEQKTIRGIPFSSDSFVAEERAARLEVERLTAAVDEQRAALDRLTLSGTASAQEIAEAQRRVREAELDQTFNGPEAQQRLDEATENNRVGSRRAAKLRAGMGGAAAALGTVALTAGGAALSGEDVGESLKSSAGNIIGSVIGGAAGALLGPVGALVGSMAGGMLGEFTQNLFTEGEQKVKEEAEKRDAEIKTLAQLEFKKRQGVKLTAEESAKYSKLSITLSGFRQEVDKLVDNMKELNELHSALGNATTNYFDILSSKAAEGISKVLELKKAYEDVIEAEGKIGQKTQKQLAEDYLNKYLKDPNDPDETIISTSWFDSVDVAEVQAKIDAAAREGGDALKRLINEDPWFNAATAEGEANEAAFRNLREQITATSTNPEEYYTKAGATARTIGKMVDTADVKDSIAATTELGKEFFGFTAPEAQLTEEAKEDSGFVKEKIKKATSIVDEISKLNKLITDFPFLDNPEEIRALVSSISAKTGVAEEDIADVVGKKELEKKVENARKSISGGIREGFQKLAKEQGENVEHFVRVMHGSEFLAADEDDRIDLATLKEFKDDAQKLDKYIRENSYNLTEKQIELIKKQFSYLIDAAVDASTDTTKSPQVLSYNVGNIFSKIPRNILVERKPPKPAQKETLSYQGPASLLDISEIDPAAEQNRLLKLLEDKIKNIEEGNGTAEEKVKKLQSLYNRRLILINSARLEYGKTLEQSKKALESIVKQDSKILGNIKLVKSPDGFFDEGSIQSIRNKLETNVRAAQAKLHSLGPQTDENNNQFVKTQKAVDDAQRALDKFNDEQSRYQEAADKSREATEKLNDVLRQQKESYAKLKEEALREDLTEQLFGVKSTKNIEKYFSLVTSMQNRYANAIEKTLHLSKLQAQLDKDRLKYGSNPQLIAFQKKLTDMKKDGKKYSEDELKILDAEYQVSLKQIMLKRAEQGSSDTVLMRDAAGNWVYGAKQDEKSKEEQISARAELVDAVENLYRVSESAITANNQRILEIGKSLVEVNMEIAEQTRIAETGSVEEREEAKKQLEKLKEIRDTLGGELKLSQDSLKREVVVNVVAGGMGVLLGETDSDKKGGANKPASEALDALSSTPEASEQLDILNKILPKEKREELFTGVQETYKQIGSIGQTLSGLVAPLAADIQKIIDGEKKLAEGLGGAQAILSGKEGKGGLNTELATMKQLIAGDGGLSAAFKKANDTIYSAESKIRAQFKLFENYAFSTVADFKGAGTQIASAIESAAGVIRGYVTEANKAKSASSKVAESFTEVYAWLGEIGDLQAQLSDINLKAPTDDQDKQAYYSSKDIKSKREGLLKKITTLQEKVEDKGYGVKKYDTGGYTGEFSGGKLAYLHEKELVLNKKDTKNILDAVKINRDMLGGIGGNAKEIIGAVPSSNTSNSTVINANFPNVSSSEEIRKAFANMSNNASQFAYRMRPAY